MSVRKDFNIGKSTFYVLIDTPQLRCIKFLIISLSILFIIVGVSYIRFPAFPGFETPGVDYAGLLPKRFAYKDRDTDLKLLAFLIHASTGVQLVALAEYQE